MKRDTMHSFKISWDIADQVLFYWSERNHTYFTKLPGVRKSILVGKKVWDLHEFIFS